MEELNIKFIKQATASLLESDGWDYANAGYVRAGADPVYQYVGSERPESFSLDEWGKLFFSNGKRRRTAYFGIVVEFLGGGDRQHVRRLLTEGGTAAWTDALFRRLDLKLLRGWDGKRGWDPYRSRERDETPADQPVDTHNDPIAALQDPDLPNLYLVREIQLPSSNAEISQAIEECLTALLPIWRSITLHQLG